MLKKNLFATALLTLLPSSYMAAYPDWDNGLAGKTKVAIYFGFGIPSGGDNTYKDYDWRTGKPVGKVDIASKQRGFSVPHCTRLLSPYPALGSLFVGFNTMRVIKLRHINEATLTNLK